MHYSESVSIQYYSFNVCKLYFIILFGCITGISAIIWYIYPGSSGPLPWRRDCGKRIAEEMDTFGHATLIIFSNCVLAVISSTLKIFKTGSREYGCLRHYDITILSALLDNFETVGWEYLCLMTHIMWMDDEGMINKIALINTYTLNAE